MFLPEPSVIENARLDEVIPALPNSDAVFLVWAGERSAYLAKTSMLRRRLLRVLPADAAGRKSLNLRGVVSRVDYWLTASRFESGLIHYALAKTHYPDEYLKLVKLRMPAYVKLVLANEFPRTQVTTRIAGGRGLYYGPFRTRGGAELFENQFLDFFQIRRCQENLEPRPDHPGCIYGEMNMCLRPCQQVVTVGEYASEVNRVASFLESSGAALLSSTAASRDRLSEEMNFEEAARLHKRYDRIQEVLGLRDDLVCDIDRLFGVAITPSLEADTVRLWFVCRGCWQTVRDFALKSDLSMDQRLRELVASLRPEVAQERQEHLALLARWRYSSWSDGEWIGFSSLEDVPYRRLVRAISRVASR